MTNSTGESAGEAGRRDRLEEVRYRLAERILKLARAERKSPPRAAAALAAERMRVETQLRAVTQAQRALHAGLEQMKEGFARSLSSLGSLADGTGSGRRLEPADPTAVARDPDGPAVPRAAEIVMPALPDYPAPGGLPSSAGDERPCGQIRPCAASRHGKGRRIMIQPQQVVSEILRQHDDFAAAVSSGAAWEIWAQVQLFVTFLLGHYQVAREVPYDQGRQRLDLLVGDDGLAYAIELKVESATNSGASAVIRALEVDVRKIELFHPDDLNLQAKWVIGIAYSAQARQALSRLAEQNRESMIYQDAASIGVLLIEVSVLPSMPFSAGRSPHQESRGFGGLRLGDSHSFGHLGGLVRSEGKSASQPLSFHLSSAPSNRGFAWAELVEHQTEKDEAVHGQDPSEMVSSLFALEKEVLGHLRSASEDPDLRESDAAALVDAARAWKKSKEKHAGEFDHLAKAAGRRAKTRRLRIEVPEDHLRWIDDQVDSGLFPDRDAVIRNHLGPPRQSARARLGKRLQARRKRRETPVAAKAPPLQRAEALVEGVESPALAEFLLSINYAVWGDVATDFFVAEDETQRDNAHLHLFMSGRDLAQLLLTFVIKGKSKKQHAAAISVAGDPSEAANWLFEFDNTEFTGAQIETGLPQFGTKKADAESLQTTFDAVCAGLAIPADQATSEA